MLTTDASLCSFPWTLGTEMGKSPGVQSFHVAYAVTNFDFLVFFQE